MSQHLKNWKFEKSKYMDIFRDPNSSYITEMVDDSFRNPDMSLLGVPYDGGILSHRRGARLAPDFIRKSFYNFTNYCSTHETELSGLKVKDFGNLDLNGEGSHIYDLIQSDVERLYKFGKVEIILGGDHSITLPSFKGLRRSVGNGNRNVNLVVIDQH